jgi:hypothetical protein
MLPGRTPGNREEHKRDQGEHDARGTDILAQPGHADRQARGAVPHDRAQDDKGGTGDDGHGCHHGQEDGKPLPPGSSGIRAHRSTIASQLSPRKPYGQV